MSEAESTNCIQLAERTEACFQGRVAAEALNADLVQRKARSRDRNRLTRWEPLLENPPPRAFTRTPKACGARI